MSTTFKSYDPFQTAFGEYLEAPPVQVMRFSKSAALSENASSTLIPQRSVQSLIRPRYGKPGVNRPSIGDHPDFMHLKGTSEEVHCPIVTLFMDMEASTRLNLLYPVQDVKRIKNAFICMAIEVVKAFDGHVHRIMGDAVMAYFGGISVRPETAAIDAVNCAAVLQMLVKQSVIPKLASLGFEQGFGIRVGLDYGPQDKVLWSSYGYPGMDEVTATSFHVDVASKLQHVAGRHQVMLGQSLRDFIDFPLELLEVKKQTVDGAGVEVPFLTPNMLDRDGRPINYRQHVLRWEKYLECTPFGDDLLMVNGGPGDPILIPVETSLHSKIDGDRIDGYVRASTLGPKERGIRFLIRPAWPAPPAPFVVRCRVENHGLEAARVGQLTHDTDHPVNSDQGYGDIEHWESLAYRGLHYLIVEVRKDGRVHARSKIGVYVE